MPLRLLYPRWFIESFTKHFVTGAGTVQQSAEFAGAAGFQSYLHAAHAVSD